TLACRRGQAGDLSRAGGAVAPTISPSARCYNGAFDVSTRAPATGNQHRRRAMRRILPVLVLLVVAIVGGGGPALPCREVQGAPVARIARRRLARDTSVLLAPDALRVLLCGTSSPVPSPRRAEACTAIFAGGRMWIVDTGPGSWRT